MGEKFYYYAQDIRVYIIVFSILGLENIMTPPLDEHTWRQVFTLAVSKNFYEISPNIFYPRMDIGGETEGIIGAEFPIYNYILSIFYHLFGFQDWYGRLLSWTVSCTALFYFYSLVKRISSQTIAFYSTLAYMVSVTFIYARKTMPDSFSLSLVIIGTYYFFSYLEKRRWKYLIVGFLLFSAGILSKIPSLCIASFLLIPMLDKQYDFKAKGLVIAALFVSFLMMISWYFYWMPYLETTFKNQLVWPVSLTEGWEQFLQDQVFIREKFENAFFYYPFLVFSLTGLFLLLVKASAPFKLAIFGYTFIFFLFILKTGPVFARHDYYIIPYTVLMAVGIGYFIENLKVPFKIMFPVFLILLLPAILRNREETFVKKEAKYLLELESITEAHIPKNAKIMVSGGNLNPTLMYFTMRRGWTVNNDVLEKKDWIADFKKLGMSYIVIDRHIFDTTLSYDLVFESEYFRIYKP